MLSDTNKLGVYNTVSCVPVDLLYYGGIFATLADYYHRVVPLSQSHAILLLLIMWKFTHRFEEKTHTATLFLNALKEFKKTSLNKVRLVRL